MPKNYTTDFTVKDTGENIIITNENTQNFSHDDFLQVYKDKTQVLENLQGNLEDLEEEMAEMLDEKEVAMQTLHALIESEETPDADLGFESDMLTVDDLNAFMQLQQKRQQAEQQRQQIQQIENQVEKMQPVAEKLADEDDLPIK